MPLSYEDLIEIFKDAKRDTLEFSKRTYEQYVLGEDPGMRSELLWLHLHIKSLTNQMENLDWLYKQIKVYNPEFCHLDVD
jgi:hypothetical protein